MKKFFCFLFCAMIILSGYAQEMLGIANSNYAGVSGMHLNPSSIVDSRLKLDINLFTFGISFDNDYLYIPKSKLSFFGFKNITDAVKDRGYIERDTVNDKNITFAAMVKGPSVAFAVKENYFAFHTAVRGGISISDLNYAVAKFGFEKDGMHYKPQQGNTYRSGPFTIGTMVWSEIGLSYGRQIYSKEKNYLNGAITINRLFGYGSAYAIGESVDFTVYDTIPGQGAGSGITVLTRANVKYGHSYDEVIETGGPGMVFSNTSNGHGWGFDIGFTYQYRPDFKTATYEMDGKTLDKIGRAHV